VLNAGPRRHALEEQHVARRFELVLGPGEEMGMRVVLRNRGSDPIEKRLRL
jgi:hypothetical protein